MSELQFLKTAVYRAADRVSYAKRQHSAFAARCDRNDPHSLRTLRKLEEDVGRAENDLHHAERLLAEHRYAEPILP